MSNADPGTYGLRNNATTAFIVREYNDGRRPEFLLSLAWEGRTLKEQLAMGNKIVELYNKQDDNGLADSVDSMGTVVGEFRAMQRELEDTHRQLLSISLRMGQGAKSTQEGERLSSEKKRLTSHARSLEIRLGYAKNTLVTAILEIFRPEA
jgi:cell division protein YceG involved in septum cleavage